MIRFLDMLFHCRHSPYRVLPTTPKPPTLTTQGALNFV